MAKDSKPENRLPEDVGAAETGPPREIPRLYILLGLVSLIFFQAMLLAFLLPSPNQVAKRVEAAAQQEIDDDGGQLVVPPIPPEKPVKIDTLEKPFGKPEGEKFRISDVNRSDPSKQDGFTCSVNVVIKKSDERAFDKMYETSVRRIDALIQTILRESTLDERSEPSLSVIRGRIKRRASEDLNIPYILDILITDAQTESM